MEKDKVYSYHCFMLPFVWNYAGNRIQSSYKRFLKVFDSNPNWAERNLDREDTLYNTDQFELKDAYLHYAEYQYFSLYARDALYGYDKSLVRIYEFLPNEMHNKGHYYITKNGRTYDLLINAIRVRIYNTGIGIFVMECENHGKDTDGNSQADLVSVKNINDYGRRINLPFIPKENMYFTSVCAEKLNVCLGNTSFISDFKSFASEIKDKSDVLSADKMTYIALFIKRILEFGGQYRFTSDRSSASKNSIYIYPAIDDRMYVSCFVDDPQERAFSSLMQGKEKDETVADSLYEFTFVDPAGKCSCQSDTMRDELLKQHVYTRWVKWDSIYTVSAQAFNYIASDAPDYLIEYFLTQYNRMCVLALTQLASLQLFSTRLKKITIGKVMGKKKLAEKTLQLKGNFAKYKSQLGFDAISTQEQAIELYNMLRVSLGIEAAEEEFGNNIADLHDMANASVSSNIGTGATAIAMLAAIQTIDDFVGDGVTHIIGEIFNKTTDAELAAIENYKSYATVGIIILVVGFLFVKGRRKWNE